MSQARVTIDDQLHKLHTLAQRMLANAVMARASREAVRIHAAARAVWPVDTGISRAGLHLVDLRTNTGGTLEIVNQVSYVPWIHHGATWNDLVVVPMTALASDVSRNYGPTILTAIKVT